MLDGQAEAGRGEDFIADPLGGTGVDLQRAEQARANGADGVADDGRWSKEAVLRDDYTGDQREDEVCTHVGDHVDASVDGAGAFDCFEPDREVVYVNQETGVGEETREAGGQDGPLQDDAGWEEGGVAFIHHPGYEDAQGDARAAEEANYACALPSVALLGVLEGEEEHDAGADEDDVAD